MNVPFWPQGWLLGEHNEWCKETNFENALRIPFMVHSPAASFRYSSFADYPMSYRLYAYSTCRSTLVRSGQAALFGFLALRLVCPSARTTHDAPPHVGDGRVRVAGQVVH